MAKSLPVPMKGEVAIAGAELTSDQLLKHETDMKRQISSSMKRQISSRSSGKSPKSGGEYLVSTDLYSQHYGYDHGYGMYHGEKYGATPTPSEAGDLYKEDWTGDCWWPNHEYSSAPVEYPSVPLNCQDLAAYAASGQTQDMAAYAASHGNGQSQSANGQSPMQYVQPVLVPVFFPCGVMPPSPGGHLQRGMSGEFMEQPELARSMSNESQAVARRPSSDSSQETAKWYNEVTSGAMNTDPKWKAKRAGQAAKKKLPGAVRPDEVEKLRLAVQRRMQNQVSPAPGLNEGGQELFPQETIAFGEILPQKTSQANSGKSPNASNARNADDPMLLELDGDDEKRRQRILGWVMESFWPLALNKKGCRVVQKAIDVGSPGYQSRLLENLRGHVYQAMQSPHANYVLQKFIEIMPPEQIDFIVSELQSQVLHVARHRFGCRILQRLVEHCTHQQTERMINKLLGDTTALLRHEYGNFVLQHVLQHGTPRQRSMIADSVLADIIRLSKHRLASHVVSCALIHCPTEDVQRLTDAVLHDAGQLSQLSRREYGSFVVREVHRAIRLLKENKNKGAIADANSIGAIEG